MSLLKSSNEYCPLAPTCLKGALPPSKWRVFIWTLRYLLRGPHQGPLARTVELPLSAQVALELEGYERQIALIKASRQRSTPEVSHGVVDGVR